MNAKMPGVLYLLCVVVVLLPGQALGSREDEGKPPPTAKGKFSDLTLSISTSEGPFLPLEPIPFRITIANKTSEAILGHEVNRPEGELFKVYVARKGEPFEEFHTRDRFFSGSHEAYPRVLPPGFTESVRGYLYYGREPDAKEGHYLLPAPGVYQIKATLADLERRGPTIESNVLTVEVVQPEGEDARAYAYLKSVPHGAFLTFGKGEATAFRQAREFPAFKDLEKFLEQFPKSRYALYAYYRVGNAYTRHGAPEAERQKGTGLLEKVAAAEDFFLADRTLSRLIDVYIRAQKLDKANQSLVTLLGRSKDKRTVWLTWERLRGAIRRPLPLRRVEVTLAADWKALEDRLDLDRVAICFDAKDIAYLPMKGKALKDATRWKEPRTFSMPEGTYRVSLRGGESEADLIDDTFVVVLIPELEVKGDMSITVTLTDRDVAELDEKLRQE